MREIIITEEDMKSVYDAIEDMSQEALDSWTEYIFGVEIVKDWTKWLINSGGECGAVKGDKMKIL